MGVVVRVRVGVRIRVRANPNLLLDALQQGGLLLL